MYFKESGGQGYPGETLCNFGKLKQLMTQRKKSPSLGHEACWLLGIKTAGVKPVCDGVCPWCGLGCAPHPRGNKRRGPLLPKRQKSHSFCLPAAIKQEKFCVIQQVPDSV